jgi:hypothetical protein
MSAEEAAVADALVQAERGDFASDGQVEEVWKRERRLSSRFARGGRPGGHGLKRARENELTASKRYLKSSITASRPALALPCPGRPCRH